MSLGHIMYLCGEECVVRYSAGTVTLHELEQQAAANLRQSFAVVGLLDEIDVFYKMLNARVDYIDTNLNPHVVGDKHTAGLYNETKHCRDLFRDKSFQAKLLNRSAELRALNRLYNIAKEVNRFQLEELRTCNYELEMHLAASKS